MQSWNIAINEPYIGLFLALHSMSPNRPHKSLFFIKIHPWIVKTLKNKGFLYVKVVYFNYFFGI